MSWVTEVWDAQRDGRLTSEEGWQILIDAREALDPSGVVRSVLRGLAVVPAVTASPGQHMESHEIIADREPIVIEDV
ncbi:MAG: hypothetical protein AAB263_16535 [Planctomycetota bacterium]